MLKRHYKALLLFFVLLCIIFSGCITKDSVETEESTSSFNASPGTVVYVLNTNGPVRINSWDGSTVEITVQKKAYVGGKEELEKIDIVVTESSQKAIIETTYPLYGSESVTVDMELKVPKGVVVKIMETIRNDADIVT